MNVSLIGTGLMGTAIARRLLDTGHAVTVWNRTREKSEALVEDGASVAATPADAVRASEVSLVTLSDAPAIKSVLVTPAPLGALDGRMVVQMATIGPWESKALADVIRGAGARYVEAPVLGSTPEARAGRLQVMTGGAPDDVARCASLLADLGRSRTHAGPVGQASALKLALNQLIGALVAGFSVSLGLVQRSGVQPEQFMEILRESALYAPQFDKKLPRMLERDFADPHFPVHLLRKDLELVLGAAERYGLATDTVEGLLRVVARTLDDGWVDVDYSAVYNGIVPPGARQPDPGQPEA